MSAAVIHAWQMFRRLHREDGRVGCKSLTAFLFVASHPGCRIKDVASGCGFDMATASRSVRAMGPAGAAWALTPSVGWVNIYVAPQDGRERLVYLSPRGEQIARGMMACLNGDEVAADLAFANRPAATPRLHLEASA